MSGHKFSILYLDCANQAATGLMRAVWENILRDRLKDSLFYDGSVATAEGFIAEVLRPGSLPFVILGNDEIAALSWLNCITGRMARTHFAIFRKFQGRKLHVSIGRNLYAYILTRKDAAGYMFDCLYGITPLSNPLAWKAALDCGWQKTGEIPQACFMASRGASETGVITCATREILGINDGRERTAKWEF